MTLVLRSSHIGTVRRVPIASVARNDFGSAVTADASRYRTIGSLQALALAVAAALVTPALLWPPL